MSQKEFWPELAGSTPELDVWAGTGDQAGVDKQTSAGRIATLRAAERGTLWETVQHARAAVALEEDGAVPPLNAVISGPRQCGKRTLAKQYFDELTRIERFASMEFVDVDGGQLNTDALDVGKGHFLYVTNLRGLIAGEQFHNIVSWIRHRNEKNTTALVFAGDPLSAKKLLDEAPELRPLIAAEIQLAAFTPQELAVVFRRKVIDAEMAMGEGAEELVALRCRELGLGVSDVEAWAARAWRENLVTSGGAFRMGMSRGMVEPTAPNRPAVIPARQRLAALVGLGDVKAQVNGQLDLMRAQAARQQLGLPEHRVSRHMIFEGNPGTGKTEVARLIAAVLREDGVLASGELFEVGRQDLVGNYIGHTATKVHELFERARGSVIFIDEAYSLIPRGERDFAYEAVDTLIAAMENYRDEVVVILAGYPGPMDELLKTNSGFASRVRTRIQFPDFTDDELIAVLEMMAEQSGYVLGTGVKEKVSALLSAEKKADAKTFGNARAVRRIFEDTVQRQASRLARLELLSERRAQQIILPQDVPDRPQQAEGQGFGFRFGV